MKRWTLLVAVASLAGVGQVKAETVLYVTSQNSHDVLAFDGATGSFSSTFIPNDGGLSQPIGMVMGPDRNMYVASYGNNNVRRYHGTTGAFMDVFASGSGLSGPQGLTFGPDGNLYVSSAVTNSILRYDGTTGGFIDTFVSSGSGGLTETNTPTFGPDGNLYVSSQGTFNVLRYNGATGAFIDVFVARGKSGLGNPARPTFIDFGPDGNLYVSTYRSAGGRHGKGVFRYDGTTGARIDNFVRTRSGGLDGAAGFAFGPDGDFYLASHLTNQILRYNGTTGAYVDTFAFGGGLTNPASLLFADVVPEPSAFIGLFSMGVLAFIAYVWRRRSQVK